MRRALLCLAICATACSYPDFAFLPDDGGASGQDSTTSDASVDAPTHDTIDSAKTDSTSETIDGSDDTLVDSIVDESGFDVRDTLDAAPDVAPETIVTPGCVGSTALFCDDYDTSTTPESLFDGTNIVGSGAISLETVLVSSPPHAFLSLLPPSAATENSATMDKVFVAPAPGANATVDVWILLDAATDTDGVQIFKIQGHGTGKGIALLVQASGLVVQSVGAPGLGMDYPVGIPAPTGRYVHYRMQFDLVSAAAHVMLWVDDMTTAVFDRTDVSTAAVAAESNYQLIVGAYASNATTIDFHARYDDVTFNFP